MRKAPLILVSLSSIMMLFSCSNVDNRLSGYSYDSMMNILNSTNYFIEYSKKDSIISLKEDSSIFIYTLDNEEETFIKNDEHYYLKGINNDIEVNDCKDYLIENYMFCYSNYLKDKELIFVDEYKDTMLNFSSHYYEYKTIYSSTNEGDSGLIFLIDVDTGICLERRAYGPNKKILEKNGVIKINSFRRD